MEIKVGQNFVSSVSEVNPSVQVEVKRNTPVLFADQLVYEGGDSFFGSIFGKIGGCLGWIKDTFVGLFRMIFCCDCSKGIFRGSVLNNPAEAKKIFEDLRDSFVTARNADSSTDNQEFISGWQKQFDSLDGEVQARIIKQDMKGWAISKGSKGDAIDTFVSDHYKIDAKRKQSLEFVRDLKPSTNPAGKTFYPLHDVPTYLGNIAQEYDSQVKAKDKASQN